MSALSYLIIFGVTAVLGVIIFELVVAKRKGIKIYTLSDSIVNLSCGMLERTFDFFYAVLFLAASNYVYNEWAPFQIPSNALTFIIALFVFDFLAYWHHRLSHEINFFWAAHIVHHQSEELNLTTVMRVSLFAVFNRSLFFIWMPLIGFDAYTILVCGIILGLYQFLTHSRLIGKLGFLEIFMTTPSHHRVHHARNEKYMDHNYGHIFIIWDKMFGTFVEEEEEPDYGITTGFESANPYYAQLSYWKNLFTRASRTKSWANKIRVFTKGPEWTPEDVPHLPNEYKVDEKGNRLQHKITVKPELAAYILVNMAFLFGVFLGLIKGVGKTEDVTLIGLLENPYIIGIVSVILISLFAIGRLIEQTKTSVYIDVARLVITAVIAVSIFNDLEISNWLMPGVAAFCGAMILWVIRLKAKAIISKTPALA